MIFFKKKHIHIPVIVGTFKMWDEGIRYFLKCRCGKMRLTSENEASKND